MAMPSRSFVLVAALGCGGGDPSPDAPADGFDRSALLEHVAQRVYLPIHGELAAKAPVLATAIDGYCDALDGAAGSPDDARTAWRAAMDAWDRADALLVGPAAMDGKAIRDRIYAWPLLSTCALDRDTASRFADPGSYDVAAKQVNAKSLAAIEYLVFGTSANHTCVTEPVGWSALGADLPRARCRLAEAIAVDVAAAAAELDTAWRSDGGDFAGELAGAGQSGSSIPSAHEGINRVSDGMFFVDRMVKDMKLAEPAGIAINACGTVGEPCLLEVEHPYADYTSFAVRRNLRALREVFTGTTADSDGPGFDDFLTGLGHADVAARMTQNLDAAITAADALPDAFIPALTAEPAKIQAAHAAVTVFTDDLKSQFLTLLDLEIPDDVAADND
jgi:uncharacterized protein